MPVNQFVPFGLDAQAYVMTPTAWASSSVRTKGYAPGVAQKEVINTAQRQSSSVATMIASFIATYQGADVLDNGNLAALMAQFKACFDSLYAPKSTGPAPDPGATGQSIGSGFFDMTFDGAYPGGYGPVGAIVSGSVFSNPQPGMWQVRSLNTAANDHFHWLVRVS